MAQHSTARGLFVALVASLTFGVSGAFMKPLLEAGWSPAAAVTMRAIIAGLLLAPFAIRALRGRWDALWRGRWRVLGMGAVGVAATQLAYYAAIQRIPVSMGLLLEYTAPLLLVLVAWVVNRRAPAAVVLVGSVVAIGGLVLVIGPGSLAGGVDPVGLVFAAIAAVGCAVYYIVAARPADGLPAIALASAGLVLGGALVGVVGFAGAMPFTFEFVEVDLLGSAVPWWVPMLIVAVIGTAVAYATSIAAAGMLGSRLGSFMGLLEVVFATIFAWLLLGESLGFVQLLGGALILVGIALVRSEKEVRAPIEPVPVTEPIDILHPSR